MSGSNLLFVLSGSIACYKACDAISRLVQRGHRVRAVATESALRFVGAATLEGLTGSPVATDLFASGGALDHINLSRWADLTVVCPATAHTLNRAAAGLGDDLAGALLLAHDWKKPLLLVPAMNPAVDAPRDCRFGGTAQGLGARFVSVGQGRTACGEVGEGRLAEPAEIVSAIESALVRPARKLRVLVTGGGTAEPIDGVRVLTNTSTGETSALIANHFARCGHTVTLLRAHSARVAAPDVADAEFGSVQELDETLTSLLGSEDFDAVIHAAAVSDFTVDAVIVDGVAQPPRQAKLGSETAPTLRPPSYAQLVDTLRQRSRAAGVRIVAFKLTRGATVPEAREAVARLFAHGQVDFVVHNDLANRETGNGAFPAEIWATGATEPIYCPGRGALAEELEKLLLAGAPAAHS